MHIVFPPHIYTTHCTHTTQSFLSHTDHGMVKKYWQRPATPFTIERYKRLGQVHAVLTDWTL